LGSDLFGVADFFLKDMQDLRDFAPDKLNPAFWGQKRKITNGKKQISVLKNLNPISAFCGF